MEKEFLFDKKQSGLYKACVCGQPPKDIRRMFLKSVPSFPPGHTGGKDRPEPVVRIEPQVTQARGHLCLVSSPSMYTRHAQSWHFYLAPPCSGVLAPLTQTVVPFPYKCSLLPD